jgi:hypothetical protein
MLLMMCCVSSHVARPTTLTLRTRIKEVSPTVRIDKIELI